jgi:hypothetical protein
VDSSVPLPPYDFEIGFAESKEGKLNTAKGYIETLRTTMSADLFKVLLQYTHVKNKFGRGVPKRWWRGHGDAVSKAVSLRAPTQDVDAIRFRFER